MKKATGGSLIKSGRSSNGGNKAADELVPAVSKREQDASCSTSNELTELIIRAVQGSSEAFEHLYKRYIKEIVYHARNILIEPEDAEDAAQEIIIALHRNIKGLKSPYAFKSYLLRIVYSVCTTKNRNVKQATELIDDYEELLEEDSELGPEGSLEQLELSEALQAAIKQLPPKQREALTLRFFDDLEYEEIAQLQGITVNTVGSNILRAKKALKHLIEKSEGTLLQGEGREMSNESKTTTKYKIQDAEEQQALSAKDFDDQGPQTLKGVALSPAIAAALAQSIDDSVGGSSVQTVTKGVNSILFGKGAVAAASTGMLLRTKVLIGTVLAVVLLGGASFVFCYLQGANGGEPAPEAVLTASEFNPQAHIEFSGGNIASDTTSGAIEQINPTHARLVLDEGTALSWAIIDGTGTELASGLGSSVEGAFEDLPNGDYTLVWIAENEQGAKASITREFTIDTPHS